MTDELKALLAAMDATVADAKSSVKQSKLARKAAKARIRRAVARGEFL